MADTQIKRNVMCAAIGAIVGLTIGSGATLWRLSAGHDVGDDEIVRWASDVALLVDQPPEAVRAQLIRRVNLQTVNVGHLHARVRDPESLKLALQTAEAIEASTHFGGETEASFARHAGAVRRCIILGGGTSAHQVAQCVNSVISGPHEENNSDR
ncbi:MAG: hypothetical protein WD081_01460 [Gammaproteobacteria bacterium]